MEPDRNRPEDVRIYDTDDSNARGGVGQSPEGEAAHLRRMHEYWRRNIRLILILLGIWALVSYGFGILLANPLSAIRIGQINLAFWFAQQGSIVIFVILIIVYAVLMDRLDREYNVHE
jgi:putative solute:sodium symporter small subunit